jgi:hypothetical protein
MRSGIWRETPKERSRLEDSHNWEDIKIDLKEIGWEAVDLVDLALGGGKWRPVVNTVMYLRAPLNVGNF